MERNSRSRSFLELTLSVVGDDFSNTNSTDTGTNTGTDRVSDSGSRSLLVGSGDGNGSASGSDVLGLNSAVPDRLIVRDVSHRLGSRGGLLDVGVFVNSSDSVRSGPGDGSVQDGGVVVVVITAVRRLSVGSSGRGSFLLSDRCVLGGILLVCGHDGDGGTSVRSRHSVAHPSVCQWCPLSLECKGSEGDLRRSLLVRLFTVRVVVVRRFEQLVVLVVLNTPVLGVSRSLVLGFSRDDTSLNSDLSILVDIVDISVKLASVLALFGETQTTSPIGEVRVVVCGTSVSGCHFFSLVVRVVRVDRGSGVVGSENGWEVCVFWDILWFRRG